MTQIFGPMWHCSILLVCSSFISLAFLSLKGNFTPLRFSSCFELNLSSCVLQHIDGPTVQLLLRTYVKLWFQTSSWSHTSWCHIWGITITKFLKWVKYLQTLNLITYFWLSVKIKQKCFTDNTWNLKLFKSQILLLINLFKILNIWTQVYYMQNYWTSHGIREK